MLNLTTATDSQLTMLRLCNLAITRWATSGQFTLSLCTVHVGALASQTRQVRSALQSYDEELAAQLWDLSADTAKLPRNPSAHS